ncbi:unnamed protein product [Amaranthus hypochondriacus]
MHPSQLFYPVIIYTLTLLCGSAQAMDVWSKPPNSDAVTNDEDTFSGIVLRTPLAKIGLPTSLVILIFMAYVLRKYCCTRKNNCNFNCTPNMSTGDGNINESAPDAEISVGLSL